MKLGIETYDKEGRVMFTSERLPYHIVGKFKINNRDAKYTKEGYGGFLDFKLPRKIRVIPVITHCEYSSFIEPDKVLLPHEPPSEVIRFSIKGDRIYWQYWGEVQHWAIEGVILIENK